MPFKPFRIHGSRAKVSIEFSSAISAEEHFDRLIKLLKVFGMRHGRMVCICYHDKDIINLSVKGNDIEINIITGKKPFFRLIRLEEIEVAIDSDKTLKSLLNISNTYDAMLRIVPMKNSETEMIINDNGKDYINFDNKEYDTGTVKAEIEEIFKISGL